MKTIVLFAFIIASVASSTLWGQEMVVSNNSEFNAIVKVFSGFPTSPTGRYLSAQIEKANKANGVYRNVIRLWYGSGNADYINLVYSIFPNEDEAKVALKEEIRTEGRYVVVNWDAVDKNLITIDLTRTTFIQEKEIANLDVNSHMHPSKKKNDFGIEKRVFNLSFEGLSLNGQVGFEGTDCNTGLNADFYSREKKTIVLQGTKDKAWAELINAPKRKGRALHFVGVTANDHDSGGGKVRITGSIKGQTAIEIVNSVDIYIPHSMKELKRIEPAITWLTIQEYWCAPAGIPVEGEPQFRMTLGMLKKAGRGNKLFFDLKAQDLETVQLPNGRWEENYTTLYELDDREEKKFEIPFGKWFNLRTEIVAGDGATGHFRLVATDNKGHEIVIFDEDCQTFASGYLAPGAKRPLYKIVSPLKLYSSERLLQYMKGNPLEIYYDNWNYEAVCVSEE